MVLKIFFRKNVSSGTTKNVLIKQRVPSRSGEQVHYVDVESGPNRESSGAPPALRIKFLASVNHAAISFMGIGMRSYFIRRVAMDDEQKPQSVSPL